MLDNYQRDEYGVIHQVKWKPKPYDKKYLSYYEGLHERTIRLGALRTGYICGHLGVPDSVLEIGYGTGAFIGDCKDIGVRECFGSDIADYPLPEGCSFVPWDEIFEGNRKYEVIAMFDVLEHIPDLSFVKDLPCDYVVITVPDCKWELYHTAKGEAEADRWLKQWRMLLPDEHLHHFDAVTLQRFMNASGFKTLDISYFEDGFRRRPSDGSVEVNGHTVATGLFRKRG